MDFIGIGPRVMRFLREHYMAVIAIVVALLAAGVMIKFFERPAKVVEKEKLVYQDRIEYRDKVVEKVVEKKVYVRDVHKNVHEVVTDIKRPDGTTEHKVETIDTSTSSTHTTDDKTQVKTEIKYVDRIVTQTVEKEKIVTSAVAGWQVGVGVGYDIMSGLGHGTRGVPGMLGAVVLVEADRRIFGPMWGGVWGTTTGVVGVRLSATF